MKVYCLYGPYNMWPITSRLYNGCGLYTFTVDGVRPGEAIKHASDTSVVPRDVPLEHKANWEKQKCINGVKALAPDGVPVRTFNHISDDIQLVSFSHLRINEQLTKFEDLDSATRKRIWGILYEDKVVDYNPAITLTYPDKNVFLIPSLITPPYNPGNVLTPEERLQMTVEQCISIKKNNPDNIIVLMEASKINFYHLERLYPHIDKLILFDNNSESIHNVHLHKTLGEANLLYKTYPLVKDAKFIVKLGNRYKLLDSFDLTKLPTDKISLCIFPSHYSREGIMEPVCYMIPFSCYNQMAEFYHYIMSGNMHNDIEHTLYRFFSNRPINVLDRLHVIGYSACAMYNLI